MPWYAVVTNPKCETRAQSGLIDKGFAVFLPRYREERRVGRQRVRKLFLRCLMPRYLFVHADKERWHDITRVDGVKGLIRDCGEEGAPVSIADKVIMEFLDSTNYGLWDVELPKDPRKKGEKRAVPRHAAKPVFDPGECVTVMRGPFTSFHATVVEALSDQAARVLITIFGQDTEATMSLADLQAA